MSTMLISDPYSRLFGVEIEFGFPNGTAGVTALLETDSFYNFEVAGIPGWSMGYDGSGVELRTPPMGGPEGYEAIRKVMTLLRENGGYVTDEDGMHVHHDAPEFARNHELCLALVESWRNNEDAIYAFVDNWRADHWACPAWSDYDFEELERWAKGNHREGRPEGYDDGYLEVDRNDLNVGALIDHGSIEIRLHEGTLDHEVAVAWIQFGQNFLHEVVMRARPMRKAPARKAFMQRIRLSQQAQRILEAKAANGHNTPLTARGDTYYEEDQW